LKQPFEVPSLDSLEKYMHDLARSIEPFRVNLTHLELVESTIDGLDTGILWLNVEETESLRQLHNLINAELTLRFGDVSAPFDGPGYHFHMSVAIGGQPIETYRKIRNEFSDRLTNLSYTVRELVMFVYDNRDTSHAGYMTYLILPLGEYNDHSY
jgi:2'-5' RNA ligase